MAAYVFIYRWFRTASTLATLATRTPDMEPCPTVIYSYQYYHLQSDKTGRSTLSRSLALSLPITFVHNTPTVPNDAYHNIWTIWTNHSVLWNQADLLFSLFLIVNG
jgi:hypothetical protein